ncbi:hypothetical protein C0J50_1719 [Silurus asotus]|uniref:Uncharacterized protein n=1 Tax=Silurus asotus TaxID=30991 RepID=A0AAD5F922_SILAS|nr:hypothetical protein C0J50_1719 [Silurus asotus]
MENMPPPPYPGPPLESTDYVQQRPVIPELAPHQQCSSQEYKQQMNIKQCGGKQELVYAVHESPCELDMTMQVKSNNTDSRILYKEPTSHQAASYQHYEADVNQKVYAHSNLTGSKQMNLSFEKSMTSMQYEQAPNIKQKSSKEEMVFAVHEAAYEHNMNMQCAASSSAMVATESRAFSMNKLRTSLEQNFSEAKYSTQKSTFEIAKQATEYTKVSAQKVALSQYSSNTQLAQAQTSASMYTQSTWNAVQPGVQVVQAGGTQVILPAQRQQVVIQPAVSRTIIQPVNPQPTVVIQNPSPTYRVIQPQVLPTVIQPAPSTVGECLTVFQP